MTRPLLLILLVGAAVRLALWAALGGGAIRIWDEEDYHAIATNLATRGEFALVAGEPTSLRPPLYPALLAASYELFGVGDWRPIRLFQAALSLVTAALAYRLGRSLHDRRVGLWAAGLACFYPSLLAYNNLVLTEVLFTALLIGACVALVEARRSRSTLGAAGAGVLLGLGALTRSVLWPTSLPLGIWLAVAWGGGARGRAAALAAFWIAFAATLAPWAIRNTRLERTFQVVDSMGGRNLMMGNYEYTPLYRAWDAISLEGDRYWFSVLARDHPEARRMTSGQRDKLAMREGVRFARRHPWLTLKRDVVKFFDFWGLERELVAGAAGRPAAVVAGLSLLVFGGYASALVSGIAGAIVVPPVEKRDHALLLLMMALVCAAHSATFGHSRYHLPLMPIVLTYSAAAIVRSRDVWARRGRPSFWLAVALASMFATAWALGIAFSPDFARYMELLGR